MLSRSATSQLTLPSLLLLWLSIGCREGTQPEVQLVVDEGGPRKLSFVAESAFAEYIELPNQRHELRIVLADYKTSCDEFVPPEQGQSLLTLTILTPPDSPPEQGVYPWKDGMEPASEEAVKTPYSIPKAHHDGRSFLFQPGGAVELSSVDLSHHGHVSGLLNYEFPGDAEHASTAIRGSFEARFCRFLEAPPE